MTREYTYISMDGSTMTDAIADAIAEIHNSWTATAAMPDPLGFLLFTTSAESVLAEAAEADSGYLVAQSQGRTVGFLKYEWGFDPAHLEYMDWDPGQSPETVAGRTHLHVIKLATARAHSSRGVARGLYEMVFGHLRPSHVSTFVAVAPHRNERSLTLHERLGFERVGLYKASEFAGLAGFESLLLLRGHP